MLNKEDKVKEEDFSKQSSNTRLEREEQIVLAAIDIFANKGYDGSRTKEIAEKAGVSEALLFKYFPAKKDLLLAIVRPFELVMEKIFMDGIRRMIAESSVESLDTLLYQIMKDRAGLLLKHKKIILTMLNEALRHPELRLVLTTRVLPKIRKLIDEALAAAKTSGKLRIDDSAVLARSFLSLTVGMVVLTQLQPELFGAADNETNISTTIDLFLHGALGGEQ